MGDKTTYPVSSGRLRLPVSMNGICKHSGSRSLRLSPEASITLQLDASNSIHSSCRVELLAPETHSISLLFVKRKTSGEKKTAEMRMEESRPPKCPLDVSFLQFVLKPEEVKMCLDLCSEKAFESVDPYIDLLPPRVNLEWMPSVKYSEEILASEIVIAAVGRGREICSQPDMFPCRSIGYQVYCISKDLVCDGKRNCPFEGRDEDKEVCATDGNYDKDGFGLTDSSNIGRGWEFLALEFPKKFTSKDNLGHLKKTETSSSTEKSTILWSDDGNLHARDSESLPDVLKHYGPWGYLMLGMLICGTVLMFCGLWECCCRRPKALVSNAVGPALLIINQGAQQNELEVPSTPGPPRYEELDQPPSYNTLFPPSKTESGNATSNSHPTSLPLVNSISILLSSNSSSQLTTTSNFQNRLVNCGGVGGCTQPSGPPSTVFTIEVQNGNGVEGREVGGDPETRPK
ncbi:hypothetical protein RUM43_005795 [Polyplax serrata]|uniref:Uncharacterized protein n=1 Tax=Polyplax serrata TaxID=468196 RepID=A0AAN8RUY2_POLSC